jgi:hypothetical protein
MTSSKVQIDSINNPLVYYMLLIHKRTKACKILLWSLGYIHFILQILELFLRRGITITSRRHWQTRWSLYLTFHIPDYKQTAQFVVYSAIYILLFNKLFGLLRADPKQFNQSTFLASFPTKDNYRLVLLLKIYCVVLCGSLFFFLSFF